MVKKQTEKKEPVTLIHRYLIPISLLTTLFYFAWIILDWVANIVDDGGAFLKGLRFAGIGVTLLVLVVLGLFLAYTTLECFKFKRSMLKERLSILIFNTIVCIVLLVLFLLVAIRVCQYNTWYNRDTDTTAYAKNGRLMGATFVLLIYISVFLIAKAKVKQLPDNVQMIKSIIWTMTLTSIASMFLMAFRIVGGFLNFQQIFEQELFTRLATAAIRAGNISIMMFGICTIFVICIIPLLFLIEKKEDLIKNQILISALIGGISLILFVVTLAVMDENIIKFEEQETGTTVCTILLLCNFASVILFTIFSFINNKKFFGLYIDFLPKKKVKSPTVEFDEEEIDGKDEQASSKSKKGTKPIVVTQVDEESLGSAQESTEEPVENKAISSKTEIATDDDVFIEDADEAEQIDDLPQNNDHSEKEEKDVPSEETSELKVDEASIDKSSSEEQQEPSIESEGTTEVIEETIEEISTGQDLSEINDVVTDEPSSTEPEKIDVESNETPVEDNHVETQEIKTEQQLEPQQEPSIESEESKEVIEGDKEEPSILDIEKEPKAEPEIECPQVEIDPTLEIKESEDTQSESEEANVSTEQEASEVQPNETSVEDNHVETQEHWLDKLIEPQQESSIESEIHKEEPSEKLEENLEEVSKEQDQVEQNDAVTDELNSTEQEASEVQPNETPVEDNDIETKEPELEQQLEPQQEPSIESEEAKEEKLLKEENLWENLGETIEENKEPEVSSEKVPTENEFVQEAIEQTPVNEVVSDLSEPDKKEKEIIEKLEEAPINESQTDVQEPIVEEQENTMESATPVEQEIQSEIVNNEGSEDTKQIWTEAASKGEKPEENKEPIVSELNVEQNPVEVLSDVSVTDEKIEVKPETIARTVPIVESVEKTEEEVKQDTSTGPNISINFTIVSDDKKSESEN